MNRKRNIAYIKPDDPPFLKLLKKEAGYDNVNHKFDKLENSEEDFAEDEESEQPQVVVLNKGDLTAEQAEFEKIKIKKAESETKADLNQKVVFKSKAKPKDKKERRKVPESKVNQHQLLSFSENNSDESDEH